MHPAPVAVETNSSAASPPKPKKRLFSIRIDSDLLDSLHDAAHFSRRTVSRIMIEGARKELKRLEEVNGGPFPSRATDQRFEQEQATAALSCQSSD